MSMRLRAALIALAVVLTGGALAPPAQAIVVSICTIKANNPHGSTHVAGTINSQGTINCSATVDEIFIKVFLHKSTGGSWTNGSRDYFNVRSLSATGATSCSQGPAVFRTQVQYTIHSRLDTIQDIMPITFTVLGLASLAGALLAPPGPTTWELQKSCSS